jgi:hypothetical protein
MKIKNLLFVATFTIGFLTLFSSCQTAVKMVERGNYDQAITYTVKKIAGKKKKKEKFVSPLADAFNRANARDLRTIKNLKRNGNPESWDKIAALYKGIQKRQNKVAPLMPIYDENGTEASLNMVEVSNFMEESKKKAAEYHYVLAKKLLTDAANGNRFAAREAYERLEKTEQYYRNYKDKNTLQKRALDLGTTYVLLTMKNNSRTILPRGFEREITDLTTRDMNSRWKVYHAQPKTGLTYDYNIIMNLRNIEVSPSLVKEREYVDDKEIEDGWDYVLDSNGNVLKDTLGNDVKIPRKVIIKARVLETFQQKEARVAGVLEFYDNHTKEVIRRENITADAIFENYASTFQGDRRALSADSKKRIGNRPLPFPTDVDLLLNAADALKPTIKGKIAGARVIL